MTREQLVWLALLVLASIALCWRATGTEHGMAKVYVEPVREASGQVTRYIKSTPRNPEAVVSPVRTIGVWVAALLTLCILSYLYRDNPGYKFAESLVVGVSAAYWLSYNVWDVLVPKLAGPFERVAQSWAASSSSVTAVTPASLDDKLLIIPVLLGALVFTRWVPGWGWLSRWPLALTVGTYAGLRLVNMLDADFLRQIESTALPLLVFERTSPGRFDWWQSVQNVLILIGVLSCLTYFSFSLEHRGLVGRFSRLGFWFLMITFGASFAFTVMGRITLLTMRLEFLFDDWLWLIDPGNQRPW